METRINPPSSMHRLDINAIRKHCDFGEVWSIGEPVKACIFLKLKPTVLYLGRLTVTSEWRRQGIARKLLTLAEKRAQLLNRTSLEIETRVELVENQALFRHLGFVKTADGTHEGYDQPTYVVMRKEIVESVPLPQP